MRASDGACEAELICSGVCVLFLFRGLRLWNITPPPLHAHISCGVRMNVCLCLRACMRTSVSMPACVPMSVCMSFV